MNFLVNMKENHRDKLYKLGYFLSILLGLITLFFLYTSNIEIDEGTTVLYETLDQLFVLFIILFIVCLIPTIFLYVAKYKVHKEKTKTYRKSKLNKQITLFDVANTSFM